MTPVAASDLKKLSQEERPVTERQSGRVIGDLQGAVSAEAVDFPLAVVGIPEAVMCALARPTADIASVFSGGVFGEVSERL